MKRLLLIVACAAAGCGSVGDRAKPTQTLERGVFFEERDSRGRTHDISAVPKSGREKKAAANAGAQLATNPKPTTPATGGANPPAATEPEPAKPVSPVVEPPPTEPDQTRVVDRVADGAKLDVNSKLSIDVSPEELGGTIDNAALRDLQSRADALSKAMDRFGEFVGSYLENKARADAAWSRLRALPEADRNDSEAQTEFNRLKKARGEAELSMLNPLRELWPHDSVEALAQRQRVEELVAGIDVDPAKSIAEINDMAQARLRAWNESNKKLAEETKKAIKSRRVRIEAFLVDGHDSKEKHAVHVEGYDNLEAGVVSRIDPFGLTLTDEERARLVELVNTSRELAEKLEKIRKGEAKWNEVFHDTQNEIVKRIAEFTDLAKSLSEEELKKKLKASQEILQTFIDGLKGIANNFTDEQTGKWKAELTAALEANSEFANLDALSKLAARLEAVGKRWKDLKKEDLPKLIMESVSLAKEIKSALSELKTVNWSAAVQGFVDSLQTQLSGVGEEVRKDVLRIWEPVRADLMAWKELGNRAHSILEVVQNYLGLRATPISLPTENPAAFSVPLDSAPRGWVDLATTQRQSGDSLRVRVTLLDSTSNEDKSNEDKKIGQPLETTFNLSKLGWHADYVPAIVFVAADRNAGASNNGGFSASLSWALSYGPRDDEGDPYLSRSLGWSGGLHATFLNFGPDNDPEIGLGVTFGLWQNRLLFGAGYNPFAETGNDARVYYFIGSSLIPLLQALQSKD